MAKSKQSDAEFPELEDLSKFKAALKGPLRGDGLRPPLEPFHRRHRELLYTKQLMLLRPGWFRQTSTPAHTVHRLHLGGELVQVAWDGIFSRHQVSPLHVG